ncbi:MAG: F0F1 ATP synthase subunit epsilon [Macellibacteroides sp.]|uniref:F0F1 ATP synthase subunit epsilon n=1 Tax=Macellibacteroides sp. TaxID=2014584 RepID=UPI003E7C7E5F
MKLEIVSPKGPVFDGEVDSVLFPGLTGDFMILPHHAPLLAVLSKGAIRIGLNGGTQIVEVSGGVVEVVGTGIHVCTD